MKRLLLNLLIFGLAAAATGESLEAIIKVSSRTLAGVLVERGQGFVIFRPEGKPAGVKVPDSQVEAISFRTETNMTAVAEQFNDGAFREVSDIYSLILPPYLPYFGLPTNLLEEFPRWMVSSYWAGDYSRTVMLVELLAPRADDSLRDSTEFYGWLARMEQGEYGEMAAFLKTERAAALYPENSSVRLYIQARLLQQEGLSLEAIRTITLLIARHSHDADWMSRAEMLCAELYFELDMPESGMAVLADITDFYSDEDIQEKAAKLAIKHTVDGEE
jgi:hypothetical protein